MLIYLINLYPGVPFLKFHFIFSHKQTNKNQNILKEGGSHSLQGLKKVLSVPMWKFK